MASILTYNLVFLMSWAWKSGNSASLEYNEGKSRKPLRRFTCGRSMIREIAGVKQRLAVAPAIGSH